MSRYISFRAPDDLADEIDRFCAAAGSRSQLIVEILSKGIGSIAAGFTKAQIGDLSRSPVQGVPDVAPQAPTRQSSSRRPATEIDGKPIPKNQQLATLTGPRCPNHRDFLWAECRRPACKLGYSEWLDRQKGEVK